ncbi:hypothetical protein HCU64_24765, partial [Methylobacterium sp. C25]|uniref:hypothetical protein n=1 Tax=Methylobacterium sp. C25 TaxID=2721622 RepID=UPI001F209603
MDDAFDHLMMGHALEEAQRALAKLHFPVGAVLATGRQIIATGHKAMGCQTALNIDPGSASKIGSDSLSLMPWALRLRTSMMEPQHASSLSLVEPRTHWIPRR